MGDSDCVSDSALEIKKQTYGGHDMISFSETVF